jgi:hypothetical protein
MRRYVTRLLVLVGICWLCVTGTVFADDTHQEHQKNHGNQGYHGPHGNQGYHGPHGNQAHHGNHAHRVSAPEIDVGAAAGALTIAAGALTLLGERVRRS